MNKMGYTTKFEGRFAVTPQLRPEHAEYLKRFSETRRMKRNAALTAERTDWLRNAVGLPVGEEGGYFVGSTALCGQEWGAADIINRNQPPAGQPGLWCQWVPTEDRSGLEWNGAEKFYDYEKWLAYLLDHFLTPWEYAVSGCVKWQGEDMNDRGRLIVEGNRVTAQVLE